MNINEKISHLNDLLNEKYHVTLDHVIKIDAEKLNKIIENKDKPTEEELKQIAELFYLDVDSLTSEEKDLPHDDSIQVDEELLNIRCGEYKSQVGQKKNKNVIKKNYSLLDKKGKKKFWINLALTTIPFIAYVLYSIISVSINVADTLQTYKEGDTLSASQQKIEDSLPKYGDDGVAYFTTVNVGTVVENISNISASSNSYKVTLTTRFDFDQLSFHKMFYEMKKGEAFNADGFYTADDLLADNFCFDSEETGYLPYKDNIPDILQFNFADNTHMSESNTPISVSTLYTEEISIYPGEKSSNVFSDKNDEFSIGNGKMEPDSMEYLDRGTAYYDAKTKSYRYGQKVHFNAVINKKFDSPRYPLDSAQFHIYIQPRLNTDYIRYVADEEMSGFSTFFSISDGYQLIKESDDIKNLTIKLNYYEDADLDRSSPTFGKQIYKSQLEIIVRANKTGFSVFVNSFLNIIAVAIWLILAFYNQSFNREDSISMIGTGFFSAISAILLGFSLVSNANIFSLLSVINIFTLCMVLIMGYESISQHRAKTLGDASMLAYRNARVRVLFYFLVGCSVVMYILLPAISYLWIL